MNVAAQGNWADRLGSTTRYTLIVLTSILATFVVGMIAGFSYAIYEDGHLPTRPMAYAACAGILGLAVVVGWVLATLIRSLRPQSMSGFDRRYWKMWAVVAALGMPIGIVLAVVGLGNDGDGLELILSNAPIAAPVAIAIALSLTVLLGIAAVYYHRTIDDHEERAYLWGSTLAYYFLILAFPLHWLLARGGLVAAMTIGTALLLVLLSCIFQAIVWALFKFR